MILISGMTVSSCGTNHVSLKYKTFISYLQFVSPDKNITQENFRKKYENKGRLCYAIKV
jgi:hypothetical protein